jgi:hypothetical protein
MARKPSDFANHNTTTRAKLNVIKNQVSIVRKHFPRNTLTGYCLGIPGAGIQTKRHRSEYRRYGIPDARQVMIDYDITVHNTQVEYMSGFKVAVVHDELMQAAWKYWKKNRHISVIDYDDVALFEPRHEQAIRDAAAHDVEVFILVLTNRCSKLSDYLVYWKNKFNLVSRQVRKDRGKSEPVMEIQQRAVEHIAHECGYNVVAMSYQGKGPPMISFVLTRKI